MRCVALLRGINVGGGNAVPMAELRALAGDLGWRDVATYIASGNLVFTATGKPADLAAALRARMADGMGVDVPVLIWPADDLRAGLESCPFPRDAGRAVHGFFCDTPPKIDTALRDRLIAPTEKLVVKDRIVWMSAPDGFGRSKLAGAMDRVITCTSFTARNLNTIQKLVDMSGPSG